MSDDLDWEIFGRLTIDQVIGVDFTAPVTRAELMSSMMTVHEALFAQLLLLQADSADNRNIPMHLRERAKKAGSSILKKTGDLVQDWAGVPRPDTSDDE